MWANETTLVGAGHNFFPRTFTKGANGWEIGKNLDERKETGPAKNVGVRGAFDAFRSRVETGETGGDKAITAINTQHKNLVNCIQGTEGTPGNWKSVSTSSLDGKLVIWKL